MKILKVGLIVLVLLGLLWPTMAWAGNVNISVDESQSQKGIRVWVKKPPEIAENPDLRLWVKPREQEVRLENPGEFVKIHFKLFSESPNKIRVEVLEEAKGNLAETELVKILTPTVEIQQNEGTARIVVVLPDEQKDKYHFVVRFLCKERVLAKADIWLEIPSRFKQFTRIGSSQDLGEETNGITIAHGIRDSKDGWQLTLSYSRHLEGSGRVSLSFKKDW